MIDEVAARRPLWSRQAVLRSGQATCGDGLGRDPLVRREALDEFRPCFLAWRLMGGYGTVDERFEVAQTIIESVGC